MSLSYLFLEKYYGFLVDKLELFFFLIETKMIMNTCSLQVINYPLYFYGFNT